MPPLAVAIWWWYRAIKGLLTLERGHALPGLTPVRSLAAAPRACRREGVLDKHGVG
jgi:hypothetical protein